MKCDRCGKAISAKNPDIDDSEIIILRRNLSKKAADMGFSTATKGRIYLCGHCCDVLACDFVENYGKHKLLGEGCEK